MFNIEVAWRGQEGGLEVSIESLKSSLENPQALMEAIIKTVLEPYIRAQFASEGGVGGEPWVELARETVRRRQGSSHPILQDPEHNKRKEKRPSLLSSFMSGASDHIEEIDRTTMVWGSRQRIAVYHQEGTSRMPRRQIMQITPPMKFAIGLLVKKYIAQSAIKAGFQVTETEVA